MTKILVAFLLGLFAYFQSTNVHPFEVETHRALSNKAVRATGLDTFLKQQLNFSLGINEQLSDGVTISSVIDWVGEGSVREDDIFPFPRSLNHFHNPLRTWDSPLPFPLGFSSIIWGQGTAVSNEFQWQNARVSFFNGLVASTLAERERLLALITAG